MYSFNKYSFHILRRQWPLKRISIINSFKIRGKKGRTNVFVLLCHCTWDTWPYPVCPGSHALICRNSKFLLRSVSAFSTYVTDMIRVRKVEAFKNNYC